MREEGAIEVLARCISDIREMKQTQLVGGDSWQVYKVLFNYAAVPGRKYKFTFVPDTPGTFTAQMRRHTVDGSGSGGVYEFFPDYQTNGVWYYFAQESVSAMIYTTKKGTVTVQDIT